MPIAMGRFLRGTKTQESHPRASCESAEMDISFLPSALLLLCAALRSQMPFLGTPGRGSVIRWPQQRQESFPQGWRTEWFRAKKGRDKGSQCSSFQLPTASLPSNDKPMMMTSTQGTLVYPGPGAWPNGECLPSVLKALGSMPMGWG